MKAKIVFIAAVALCAASPFSFAASGGTNNSTPAADSRIDVIFDHPENFTDLKDSQFPSEKVQQAYMAMLNEFIKQRASRVLPEGQKLSVTFQDIDMAGDFEPWRGANFSDVRVVKDIYPPRLKLIYKITDASGATVKEGKRELQDLNFQWRQTMGFRDDPLRYEKELVDDWIRQDVKPSKKK